MSCAPYRDELSAWLDGELAPERARQVGAHVEGCAECSEQVEALAGVDRALAALPLPELRSDSFARLQRRVVAERAAPPAPIPLAPRRRRLAWSAGAAAALAAGLALYFAVAPPAQRADGPEPDLAQREALPPRSLPDPPGPAPDSLEAAPSRLAREEPAPGEPAASPQTPSAAPATQLAQEAPPTGAARSAAAEADPGPRVARQDPVAPQVDPAGSTAAALLDEATDEELAVALELETVEDLDIIELETVEDLDVIANLELLEALLDLEAGTG